MMVTLALCFLRHARPRTGMRRLQSGNAVRLCARSIAASRPVLIADGGDYSTAATTAKTTFGHPAVSVGEHLSTMVRLTAHPTAFYRTCGRPRCREA
jgi:hypothetical protein